jgi:hypothetical protein
MAVVLILPLPPGGNFPPALACAILGMGLVERDGLIILIGLAATIAASVVAVLLVGFLVESFPVVVSWAASLFGH